MFFFLRGVVFILRIKPISNSYKLSIIFFLNTKRKNLTVVSDSLLPHTKFCYKLFLAQSASTRLYAVKKNSKQFFFLKNSHKPTVGLV
jgi:hypothetical protein